MMWFLGSHHSAHSVQSHPGSLGDGHYRESACSAVRPEQPHVECSGEHVLPLLDPVQCMLMCQVCWQPGQVHH